MSTQDIPRNIKVNLNDIRHQLVKLGRPPQQNFIMPTSSRVHRMRDVYVSEAEAQICSEHNLVVSPLGRCGKCK
jgi:hypothetical protein